MTDKKTLVERIRKLLALSESSNQHEAELAAKKASDLMKEHQIAESEVELKDVQSGAEAIAAEHVVPGLKMKYLWVVNLGAAAGKLFDCECLSYNTLHGTRLIFVGLPDDVEMAKITFNHLWRSWNSFVVRDLASTKREARSMGYGWAPRDTMKYKLGHGQGYAGALYARAQILARERKQDVAGSGATGKELVVVKDALVERKVESLNPKSASKQRSGDMAGYIDGKRAGNTVALGGEIRNG